MRTKRFIQTILAVVILIGSAYGVSVQSTRLPHPFQFTENKGQWDSAVVYKCEVRRDGFAWFLERDGVTLVTSVIDSSSVIARTTQSGGRGNLSFDPMDRDLPPRYALKSHALKFKFVGECATQEDVGINSDLRKYTCAKSIDTQGELSWHNNYFLGNDSSKWAPDCRNFTRVVYHDVWDGIDVEWYESKGHLEFDFVVHPGADPKQIKMVCEGLEAPIVGGGRTLLSVDSINSITKRSRTGVSDLLLSNELSLPTSLGELRMSIPGAYQTITDGTHGNNVTAQFRLESGNVFAIDLPNGYDNSQMLRIDPLVYSTYLGGSGNDVANAVVNDMNGGCVVTGETASNNFPITEGAGDISYNGSSDCFIAHVNSDGSALIFCTYLGGSDVDYGSAICNDSLSGVIVTGSTFSENFPADNLFHLSPTLPTSDCFITKVNSSGSRLIYSQFIGGMNSDVGEDIIPDGIGGAIITGNTSSTDFPITTNAYNITFNGGEYDCFISHINPTGSLIFNSTYFGGTNLDFCNTINLNNRNQIIIAGFTSSSDFPATINSFDSTFNRGWSDGFISIFDSTCSNLLFSTYLGGDNEDVVNNILINSNRNVVMTGETYSTNYPVTAVGIDTSLSGSMDCILSVLDCDSSRLVSSTFLGGLGYESGNGLFIDNLNSIYITGITNSSDFPTTIDAYSRLNQGGYDCFVAKLNYFVSNITYSTYFGGNGTDNTFGMVTENNCSIVFVGSTTSSNLPTTISAFDTVYNGGSLEGDCFITQFRFDTLGVKNYELNLPTSMILCQNYPNPYNSSTTIEYSIPSTEHVKIDLFDLLGRKIRSIVDEDQYSGVHRIVFNAKSLPSGEYFYRFTTNHQSSVRKMMIIK